MELNYLNLFICSKELIRNKKNISREINCLGNRKKLRYSITQEIIISWVIFFGIILVVIGMFVDTHCHIYAEYYDNIDELIKKIKASKISKVINNGCDSNSNKEVIELINKYDCMYGAIGIHPEYASTYSQEDLKYIKKNLDNKKVVAIGEIGLDYHYGKENKDLQIKLFREQLEIAQKYNKPVIIHSRDATLDTIDVLRDYKVKGVIHSFSGSYETAKIYLSMGFILGINGVVTFKNCNLSEVLRRLSLDDFILETDSPYLTPVPFRGQKNDSSHIIDIAKFISEIKGVSLDHISLETNANVARFFDI